MGIKRVRKINKSILELNGFVTLSQLSRSYILSGTALSGINMLVKLPMINVVSLRQRKKAELEKTKD